jgi:hypothetical protein
LVEAAVLDAESAGAAITACTQKNDRTKEKANLDMGEIGTDKKRKKTIEIFFRRVEMKC